jgi:glucose-6-phosphate isomerase
MSGGNLNWKYFNGKLYQNDQELKPSAIKKVADLRDVLLDPTTGGPDVVYQVYTGILDATIPKEMTGEITALNPGLIGREYAKTHGHYHIGEGIETYRLLAGHGLVILQQPDFNFDQVEAVRIIKMEIGQDIEITPGWGHSLVNVGSTVLLVLDFRDPTKTEHSYEAYKKLKGAAYYVVEENSQVKIEPNPHYGTVPKPQSY